MRNLAPASTRRWRVPLAPDPASDAGADERVVACCHDPESRVVYCATDAGNLYGLRVDVDAADHDPVCLDMSLLDADHPDDPTEDPTAPPERDRSASVSASASAFASTSASSRPRPFAVVGMEFLPEMQGACVALADGRLLVVAPDPDHPALLAGESVPITRDCHPECVGVVSGGLRAASWNPDGETLALVTGAGALICMTKDFRVLAEAAEGCGAGPGTANASWRGDGQFFATLASGPGFEPSTFRVWTRDDLEPGAEGERLDPAKIANGAARGVTSSPPRADDGRNEHPPLAWQPRGALIAVATAPTGTDAAPSDAASVVFYERNGLRRGAFTLPRRGAGQTVTQLAWSPDSELLAVVVASQPESKKEPPKSRIAEASEPQGAEESEPVVVATAVQIWRRGNGRWYLKRETRYPSREGARTRVSWDDPGGHVARALGGVEHVLRVYTSAGLVEEHAFSWDAAVSSAGTVAVIDGASARVTPMSRAKLPPPMCAAEIRFPAPAIELAWARTTRETVARGEGVFALLADGRFAFARATRGAEWEETAEALAEDDDEVGADVCIHAEAIEGTCARHPEDVSSHVACVGENLAMACVANARDASARLCLATFEEKSTSKSTSKATSSWTCAVVHEVALPRVACRVVPVEGGAPGRAFVILRPRDDADVDAPAEILFAEARVHPETRVATMTVAPATWDEAALATTCVVARAFAFGGGDGDGENHGVVALVGLDARGTLRRGARIVAEDVRSFGVHWSASDGAVAAGSDAPDVSLDVAVGADASGGARATPRVVYVTKSDELRVAETRDLRGVDFRGGAREGHAEMTSPNLEMTFPNLEMHSPNLATSGNAHAAAAGGKRGADEGTGKGVYMDQLHVSMRAAMRPADASRAADVRTRRVEEGARIVAAVPGAVDVVLQMPRGNLETVAPRFLALPAVCAALDGERFAAAAALAARHRVDLNLLVDYRWPRFLTKAEAFVKDVRDPDVVAEIIESLREDDVTAPGGVYAHLPKPRDGGSKANGDASRHGFADEETELARLAAGLRVGDADGENAPSASASAPDASARRGKVSSACAALRAAALKTARHEGDDPEPLLDDTWELVVLSSYARSEPPDAAAALRRVGRRRERELAEAAAVASSPVDEDASASSAADGDDAEEDSSSRRHDPAPHDDSADPDAVVVASGASALDAAAGKQSGISPPVRSSRLASSTALRHLLALEGAKALYDAAVGTYDVSLAYLVGQHSNMDPGEFVPDLRRLQEMPPALRRAEIDLRLARYASAVANLLEGDDVAGACDVAATRRLFPHALEMARAEPSVTDPDGIPPRTVVARAYAARLAEESRHEDAAVTLLSVGDAADAARQYQAAAAWRPALALAGRLGFSEKERRAMAEELADALELADPASAAAIAERELGDADRATSLLCVARRWRECVSVAYANRRGDLVETVIAPAAAEAAQTARDDAAEVPARARKYLERLEKLKRHREVAAAATATGAEYRGFGGAPRAGDEDDDGASVASLSTLASGVTGMSAYTDRTLGAATASTRTGASSRAASTVGGRAPKRKPKKKKKNSAGLRAGGPTEERDLATHLANGGVAETLVVEGALEEIGELAELLVLLGAAEDAAKLQRAVAAAMDASENAAAAARATLAALDDAEKRAAEAPANPDGTRDAKTCDCHACRRATATRTCAGKRQWKWAALRTAKP